MLNRTCSVPDCGRQYRAKGLCARHYNLGRDKYREVQCAVCGSLVRKCNPGVARRSVCSDRCRHVLRWGQDWAAGREVIGPVLRRFDPRARPPSATQSAPPAVRFVAGSCRWCGAGYTFDLRVGGVPAKYCDPRCARNASRARQRELRGVFAISRRRRLAIYERDGWTCQLCFEPVDRSAHYLDDWAPSLDHIVPQSRQLVPDHSDGALRLSHRWCNAVRGDDTYHTAADLAPAPA